MFMPADGSRRARRFHGDGELAIENVLTQNNCHIELIGRPVIEECEAEYQNDLHVSPASVDRVERARQWLNHADALLF